MNITSGLYLTHYGLGLLAQALLSTAILGYLALLKNKTLATRILTRYHLGFVPFIWGLWVAYGGLARWYRLSLLVLSITCFLWGLRAMARFAYAFPSASQPFEREARRVARITLGITVFGTLCGAAAIMHWETHAQTKPFFILFIQGLMLSMIMLSLGIVLVFSRLSLRLAENASEAWWRRFMRPTGRAARALRALTFLFAGLLIMPVLRIGQNAGLFPTLFVEIASALLPLFLTFQFVSLYFAYTSERSTILIKIAGSSFIVMLSLFAVTGFVIGNAQQREYRPAYPFSEGGTLRFEPDAAGGYAVAANARANAFDPLIGAKLECDFQPRLPMRLGFAFPFYGKPVGGVFIQANGWLMLTDDLTTPDAPPRIESAMFRLRPERPAIAPLLMSFTAAPDGGVFYNATPDSATVTWLRMIGADGLYTFQTRLYRDGAFEITYIDLPDISSYDAEAPLHAPMLTGIFPGPAAESADWRRAPAHVRMKRTGAGAFAWFYYADFRDDLHQRMRPFYLIMLTSALLMLIGLPLYFRSFLLKPLSLLQDGARQIAAGRLDVALDVQSHDELGFLTQAFNRMVKAIDQAERNLHAANEMLEEKVITRTQELSRANAELRDEIHERLAAEAALQASEKEYRLLFENLQDVFYRANMLGDLLLVSPSCERVFGYAPREAVGLNLFRDIYSSVEEYQAVADKIRAEGSLDSVDVRLKRRDGQVIWGRVNAHYYRDHAGNLCGTEGMIMDVTARKQAEAQLRHALRETELLFAAAQAILGASDLHTVHQHLIQHFNNLIDADWSALFLVDHARREIVARRGYGNLNKEEWVNSVEKMTYAELDAGISGRVFRTKTPVLSLSADDGIEPERTKQQRMDDDTGALIVVPLVARGEVIGTFTAINRLHQRLFTQHDVDVLMSLATQAAAAIHNVRLYEAVQEELVERRRIEAALRASETEYRLLFENLQDVFIRVNEAGIVLLASPSVMFTLGYLQETVTGKPITDTIIANPEEWRQCVAAIRTGGLVDGFELQLQHWNGSRLWGSVSAQMYQDDASGRYIFEGTIRDISELKRAEAELQAKNADLQETLTHLRQTQQELIQAEKLAALGKLVANIAHEINTPLGAIRASARTILTALDETFLRLPEVIRLLSDEQQAVLIRLIQRACQPKQALTSKEERQRRRALTHQMEDAAIAQADTIADTLVDMGIYEEIEAFMPLFRHEKTMWLLGAAANVAAQRHSSENILFAVERMSKIVFALKSYAHIEASGQPTLARIQDGLEVVLTLYHNQLKHGIEVVKRYDDAPPIFCYPDELQQVWTNLIHNAMQAMQGKGRLEITVKPTPCPSEEGKQSTPLLGGAGGGSGIVVEITDSGPGIPDNVKDRIFEPFFTTKPAGEGSGMGLDICKKILDKHQGRIEFESQPGRTTFRVWLPGR